MYSLSLTNLDKSEYDKILKDTVLQCRLIHTDLAPSIGSGAVRSDP